MSIVNAVNAWGGQRNPAPESSNAPNPKPTSVSSNGASPASAARTAGDTIRDQRGAVSDLATGNLIHRPQGK